MKAEKEYRVFLLLYYLFELLIRFLFIFTQAHFKCVIKKAYPKPKLIWYMGGKILNEKSEGNAK